MWKQNVMKQKQGKQRISKPQNLFLETVNKTDRSRLTRRKMTKMNRTKIKKETLQHTPKKKNPHYYKGKFPNPILY